MDGLSVIQALRKYQMQMPVLVLSALDIVQERVRGLNVGADDYLTKPFVTAQLFGPDRGAVAPACTGRGARPAGRTARA